MYNEKIAKLQDLFGQAWELGVKDNSLACAITEEMVMEKVIGEFPSHNKPGYDILESDGTKRQVKSRVYYGKGEQSGAYPSSLLFTPKDNGWDVLDVFVLDNKGQTILWTELTRAEVVKIAKKNNKNQFRFTFKAIIENNLENKRYWEASS